MKKNNKMVYGSGEDNSGTLNTLSPTELFPVYFGKGEWAELDNGFVTLTELPDTDNKARFVFNVENTKSGAIYVGNKLASSKVLDITKEDDGDKATLKVNYISNTGELAELTFDIADSQRLEAIENFLRLTSNVSADSSSALTITTNEQDSFVKYDLKVNVDEDNDNIDIVDNAITISEYNLEKIGNPSTAFASQYKLTVKKPGTNEFVQVGETIDIMKDYFLKDAYVVTYNKNVDGTPYETTGEITAPDVYGVLPENASAYADASYEDQETGNTVYLEQAPVDQGLMINHTYLHLIINTADNTEDTDEPVNYKTNDAFLDFTEIINSDAFNNLVNNIENEISDVSSRVDDLSTALDNLNDKVDDLSTALDEVNASLDERLDTIEASYVSAIDIPATADSQYKTITVTTNVNGTSSDSSFVIPDASYYEAVQANFNALAAALTWHNLD